MLSTDTVLTDAHDILGASTPAAPPGRWTTLGIRCANTPATLCAGWGNSCGNGGGKYRRTPASCEDVIHGLCGRKTFATISRPDNPQPLSTAARLDDRGRRLRGSPDTGGAGLLRFVGVFERGGRAPARGGGHRPARGRPGDHGCGRSRGADRRRVVDGERDRPGTSAAGVPLPEAGLTRARCR
jgi:hypothetical protein